MNDEIIAPDDKSALTAIELDNNLPTNPITLDEDQLIDETIVSIRKIYKDGVVATHMQIGEIIFEKIYGNDLDCFSNDKNLMKKHSNKWNVFKKLSDKSNEMAKKGDYLPNKTFLYNAVRLVIDQKLLSGSTEYKQLSISHKIELLPIADKNKKLEVIKDIQSGNLSVRDARKRVSSLNVKRAKKTSITYYINNPDKIENEADFLGKIVGVYNTEEKKNAVIIDCEKKIEEAKALIAKSQENITKLQTLMKQVKKEKILTKRTRKKKGTKETK